MHCFVYNLLDGPYRPEDCPCAVVVLVSFLLGFHIAEAIIFKGIADDLDVTVVKVEIVSIVLRKVWSNCDRVFIRTKD